MSRRNQVTPEPVIQQQQPSNVMIQQQQPGEMVQPITDVSSQQKQPGHNNVELCQGQPLAYSNETSALIIEGESRQINCSCGYKGTASSFFVTGLGTWIWCIVLFIIFYPLLWLPFMMKSCKDHMFLCPNCGAENSRKKVCYNPKY